MYIFCFCEWEWVNAHAIEL